MPLPVSVKTTFDTVLRSPPTKSVHTNDVESPVKPAAEIFTVLFSPDPAPTKFSDGSCVSPNIFLLREVVGIRIAEAGHTVIYFSPALNQVDWAEAIVPMARGRLKVKWEKLTDGSLDVTLDANIPVKILPEMTHSQLRNTTFRLGEKVTLLDPPAELVDEEEGE